jgi:hypothetical protein
MSKLRSLILETGTDKNILCLSDDREIRARLLSKFTNVDDKFNPEKGYDFVVIDNQIAKNMNLELLWNALNYSAVIYITNFVFGAFGAPYQQLNSFLKLKQRQLITSRQMTVPNQGVENFLIVKCFPIDKQKQQEVINSMKPLVVVTVLRSGGIYTPEYVNNLANSVAKNLTVPYTFYCLTDVASDQFSSKVHKVVKLMYDFPKWWPKIEMFRRGLFAGKKVFYLDLDTLVINNIDFIASYNGSFCGLRDFYHMVSLGSGVMAWDGDNERLSCIYNDFLKNPNSVMNNNNFGDQQWINEKTKDFLGFIQDSFPNKIVSFKKDCFDRVKNVVTYPQDASIVCFHGPPRVHEMKDYKEIRPYWNND